MKLSLSHAYLTVMTFEPWWTNTGKVVVSVHAGSPVFTDRMSTLVNVYITQPTYSDTNRNKCSLQLTILKNLIFQFLYYLFQ